MQELSEEARFVHPRRERGRDRRRHSRAPCTIEMLENGGCSDNRQVQVRRMGDGEGRGEQEGGGARAGAG
eukprot:327781-Hanusia_phi.AAC.2